MICSRTPVVQLWLSQSWMSTMSGGGVCDILQASMLLGRGLSSLAESECSYKETAPKKRQVLLVKRLCWTWQTLRLVTSRRTRATQIRITGIQFRWVHLICKDLSLSFSSSSHLSPLRACDGCMKSIVKWFQWSTMHCGRYSLGTTMLPIFDTWSLSSAQLQLQLEPRKVNWCYKASVAPHFYHWESLVP